MLENLFRCFPSTNKYKSLLFKVYITRDLEVVLSYSNNVNNKIKCLLGSVSLNLTGWIY